MSFERIASADPAPWLPPGSVAEMWAGEGDVPQPAIIVRLLITRRDAFFCVPTAKGDDLPTLFLGRGAERIGAAEGLDRLATDVLGRRVDAPCVGYIRNHVPAPDENYPHPVPDAYVPVFRAPAGADPVVEGSWRTLADADDLRDRHWFKIVRATLGPREPAEELVSTAFERAKARYWGLIDRLG